MTYTRYVMYLNVCHDGFEKVVRDLKKSGPGSKK